MARVPRQVARQVIPSGRVAGAVIPTSIADVGQGIETRGLAGLGRGVEDLGVALGKIAFAEGTSEASTARGLAESEIRLLESRLQRNSDPATYDDELAISIETIKGFRPESSVGSKQFDDFMENAIPAWQTEVKILRINRGHANIKADYIANSARASAAGDITELERLIDEAVNTTGVITPEQGARDLVSGEAVVNRINKQKDETIVLDAAFAVWQNTGQLADGLAIIDKSGLDDKARLENELKTRITNRRAEEQLELEKQQEADLANINRLIFFDKNYDDANIAIQNSSLTEKEKGTLFADSGRRADAAAKGIPIVNDRVEEARLYELSLDIWRGTITKKEFDADLLANQHKLDDSAYQRVSSSAANTLKSSQAESLRRADTEAGRLIVDFREEDAFKKFVADSIKGLDPDVASLFQDEANERRQLQFWSLSRYNAELRQWIEENPDKLGKDFFQFSESLKHDYWNQSIEELRKLRERTAGEFTAAAFLAAKPLFGLRPDGAPKGVGFLGILNIKGGGVATEFSTQSNAVKVNERRIDFPTLVPTLTQEQIDLMVNDIIPNRKDIPEDIMQKAIIHAKKRIKEGKSVFADADDIPTITTQAEYDKLPKGTRYRGPDGNIATKR